MEYTHSDLIVNSNISEREGALGNNSESAAIRSTPGLLEHTDPETGEVTYLFRDQKTGEMKTWVDPLDYHNRVRLADYKIKRKSKLQLQGIKTPRGNNWKVCYCMLARKATYQTGLDGVTRKIKAAPELRYKEENNRAYFAGVMRCASNWTCPLCQNKIMRTRAGEIQQATDYALGLGLDCLMLTYTFPHKNHEPLQDNLNAFLRCLRLLKSSRRYKELLARYGFVGAIRGLEVTWGEANGFHPHSHELLYFDRSLADLDLHPLLTEIRNLWEWYCVKNGLSAPKWKIGVQLSYKADKDKVGQYLSKWSIAREVSSPAKEAKKQNCTPFQLLEQSENQGDRFGRLFREFAWAFFGRRQLYWSKGLKERLLVPEISDQEIVDQEPKDAVTVLVFERPTWSAIRKKEWLQPHILEAYEGGGLDAVLDLFQENDIPY